MKGADGYALGEALDYHDLEGREIDSALPRIIGKTNPKTEHLTEGHSAARLDLTIS